MRFGRLLRRITMRQGDQVGSAWEWPVTCSGDGGDISQQLRMPSWRHMPGGQGERRIDARRAVAALAKKVGESCKWSVLAGEVLNRRETDQPRPFEGRDPDAGPWTAGPPRGGPSGKIDSQESRFAHGAKVNVKAPCANAQDGHWGAVKS